jgi:CDP-paratose 2-epimerase
MKKKIVIITGSAGLVGSESAIFFLKKLFYVIGIDNNQRNFFFGKDGDISHVKKKLLKYKNYRHLDINITNKRKIYNLFKKYSSNITLIIHAAAQPSHDWAYKDVFLDFNINAQATLYLLEATKKFCSNAKFILTSTNKVYGDTPNYLPLKNFVNRFELNKKHKFYEGIDDSMSIDKSVHSLFGSSKLYADIITQEYGKNFGLKTLVLRAGCITGPAHSSAELHGFLSYLVKSCLKFKKYNIIGYGGKQVRDNIHSYDLVNCFWNFYKFGYKRGEVYNIGGGRAGSCSILEAIDFVENYKKIHIKKNFIKQNRTGDHKWYITSNKKFKKDFPKWRQVYNFKKIIKELIDNY